MIENRNKEVLICLQCICINVRNDGGKTNGAWEPRHTATHTHTFFLWGGGRIITLHLFCHHNFFYIKKTAATETLTVQSKNIFMCTNGSKQLNIFLNRSIYRTHLLEFYLTIFFYLFVWSKTEFEEKTSTIDVNIAI